MNQIRLIALTLITIASLQLNAQTMNGFLDLSKLNRGADAGQYFIGVGLNPLISAAFDVTQKWAEPPGDEPQPLVCYTEIRLVAGDLTLIMTDALRDTKLSHTQSLLLVTGHWDESEKCSPIEAIFSRKLTFSAYFLLGGFGLDYPAPAGFDKMTVGISVMPFGNSIELMPGLQKGKPVVRNLKSQLDAQLKRGNQEGLYFFVWAYDAKGFSEELGRGYIELK